MKHKEIINKNKKRLKVKRLLITVVLTTFTLMAQAQWAVGGQFGFNTSSTTFKPDNGEEVRSPRTTSFNIAPMIARKVADRTILGIHPEFSQARTTLFGTDENSVEVGTRFGVSVFALYNYFSIGRLLLLAKPSIGFGITNERDRPGSGDAIHVGRTSDFGIGVIPAANFHVNERIMLIASLNFMRLGFNHETRRTPGDSDDRTVTNSFGFNFNNMNVVQFGGSSPLTIGFLLKL